MVNTCGFIQAAKQESIDELLSAAESGAKVAAVGCLAERYGNELADALPEAQILSFDDYGDIAARLDDVLNGRRKAPHTPRDRRTLLPLSPADRAAPGPGTGPSAARTAPSAPGIAPSAPGTGDLPAGVAPPSGPRTMRRRLSHGVVAPLKIASGCDRRCSFCAIPAFRGAYLSRRPHELLAEAEWLAGEGVKELFLVSENSTSYGKDLGNLRLLEEVLPSLAATPGIERVRISYLQPAELRPGLIEAIAGTPGVAPYFDLSFQHASGPLLRAMRRFGDRKRFLGLIDRIRTVSPEAGIRSNFIVGFPGETAGDLHELELFLSSARLDAIGVFGYSDEDGTEAASLPGKLDEAAVARRVEEVAGLADELMAQRGADRVGETVEVLIEERLGDGLFDGRAAHQAPEVDGATTVQAGPDLRPGPARPGHRRVVGRRRPRGHGHGPLRLGRGRGAPRGTLTGGSALTSPGAASQPPGPPGAAQRPSGPAQVPVPAAPPGSATGPGAAAAPGPVAAPALINVANVLTMVRVILVPAFVACLVAGGTTWRIAAFVLFWIASATDFLDGRLARQRGLVTDFGKVADPIADKALTGAALITLSVIHELSWWVTAVILVREIGITLLRFAVIKRGVIAASPGGKLKTLLQMVAISLYILPGPFGVARPVMMGLAVAVTLATGADYVLRAARLRRATAAP